MKCPVCHENMNSPQDSSDILFNGMCSECLLGLDYYYKERSSRHMTERVAREEGLEVVDYPDPEYYITYPPKRRKK
jgi:hypothetical protein